MEKVIPILYKKEEDCCGCAACFIVCSRSAINMIEDEMGFKYPHINNNLCIRCERCLSVCPIKNVKSQYLLKTDY